MTSCNSIDEEWRGLMCRQGDEDGQRFKRERFRDKHARVLWPVGYEWKSKREIAFNFLAFSSFQKKKKKEREREIALTTYLKGILKSSSYFNTLKITNQGFCNMESQRTLIPIG